MLSSKQNNRLQPALAAPLTEVWDAARCWPDASGASIYRTLRAAAFLVRKLDNPNHYSDKAERDLLVHDLVLAGADMALTGSIVREADTRLESVRSTGLTIGHSLLRFMWVNLPRADRQTIDTGNMSEEARWLAYLESGVMGINPQLCRRLKRVRTGNAARPNVVGVLRSGVTLDVSAGRSTAPESRAAFGDL